MLHVRVEVDYKTEKQNQKLKSFEKETTSLPPPASSAEAIPVLKPQMTTKWQQLRKHRFFRFLAAGLLVADGALYYFYKIEVASEGFKRAKHLIEYFLARF